MTEFILQSVAATVAAKLKTPALVRGQEIRVGDARAVVELRGGGVAVVVPRYDAMGAVVGMFTGPVRARDDIVGIASDLVDRIAAQAPPSGRSFRWEATAPILAEVEHQVASFSDVTVEAVEDRHGYAGFEVDTIRVVSEGLEGSLCVVVAESGVWIVADGTDGTARSHDMVAKVVEDLVNELQARLPAENAP